MPRATNNAIRVAASTANRSVAFSFIQTHGGAALYLLIKFAVASIVGIETSTVLLRRLPLFLYFHLFSARIGRFSRFY